MSLMLVLHHFGGAGLPGCGEGSDCDQAANSVWGKIPLGGYQWPVSFIGLAYFFGLLVTWIVARGRFPRGLRFIVRFGVVVSLGFTVILISKGMVCPYCLGAHIGNLAFWIALEMSRTASPWRLAVPGGAAVFVLVTAVLGVIDAQHRKSVLEKAEDQRSASTQAMIERASPSESPPPQEGAEDSEVLDLLGLRSAVEPEESQSPQRGFTGRYRVGPEEAPIRIVIFTDYQCRDCREIERQLTRLYDERTDISISVKHFPFNSQCNRYVSKTLHPNACWAARAAEAAGKLWGPEGFWKMHKWLFDRRGVFETNRVIEDAIREMGYDPTGFVEVMTSAATLDAIRADTDEAKDLGILFTPMIFINGVELKGWNVPNALVRTAEEIAATNPPARSAAFDRPPLAHEKYIDDWRQQPRLDLPPDSQPWTRGPDDARVRVTIWGDYQERGTAQADSIVRAFASGRTDVLYAYRHFPVNSDCNPKVKGSSHPYACRAAKAAEAAGAVAGRDGYWRMHVWLMENRDAFGDQALREAVDDLGLDEDAFFAAMDDDALMENVADDVRAGGLLPSLRHGMPPGVFSVPTIFVNERYVPRWWLDGRSILGEILAEAAKE